VNGCHAALVPVNEIVLPVGEHSATRFFIGPGDRALHVFDVAMG
jgi:hypothetical protein